MSTLTATKLKKKYGKRIVVNDVCFAIKSHEITGILGPNGTGKTTCFYMIVGLVQPTGGKIMLDQTDITHASMHVRARSGLGYLPQEASIFRKMSVANNIMAILEMRKDLDKKSRSQKLESLLDEFNISYIRNSLGISLSGGERRRVEIARALAMDPSFILLDEPFAGIDPISVNEIKKIIIHLKNRGVGILITDHNVRETLDICDCAYIMSEGKIIAEGNSEYIMQNQQVRDVYLGKNFDI
ncbi:MAG: LPS export ABC transporter ATP-binding protein [Endozoicomonadaceae bacterium]|nr:LPS export ABC transporter ATP-binding protein [Endozoicomonadaceae bacterium]MCY4329852.1 LPS export ABC transporter ATP-binding protein [Endozoicomonadaceae bacterium]